MATGFKSGGRKKGTPNKKTAEQLSRAEKILQLIEDHYFKNDIKKLTSFQRINLYTSMLEYVAPKLSRTEVRGSGDKKLIVEIVRKNIDIPSCLSRVRKAIAPDFCCE
jgi:hypothetical protein